MSDREEFEEAWAENGVANNPKIKRWCRQFWGLRQPELDALKEEIELCHRKLEGLDEIVDALKAENERLRKAAEEALDVLSKLGCEVTAGKIRAALEGE